MSNTMTAVETAKKTDTGLREKLQRARTEKDVENTYRFEFQKYLPSALITSPHNTDGVLETETLFVLLEFKYDLDFKSRTDVMKPVAQTLLYLKTFSQAEDRIPSAVFVGDKNECFMLPTSALTPYLERSDIEWDTAPSDAWRTLPALYRELILDTAINPYVLDIRERKFYFGNVIKRLESIHKGAVHRVPITIHNISGIFKSWEERVLRGATDPHTAVGAFIQCVLGEAYLHPRKSNTLVVGDAELSVRGDAHEAFFDWFQNEYRVSEKREFTAIKDRLIEEESRRRSGDFYTPAVWAHEAHKLLDAELGPDWRDEWIVWDCAAGTANLTRDYHFKELYLSTLFESDVNTIKTMGYNPNAEVFQFDFLNDPLPGDGLYGDMLETGYVPSGLIEALKGGKKMVFLINPPFGTHGSGQGKHKAGVADKVVKDAMRDLGHAKSQLYAQFMFRITEIVEKFDLEDAAFALYSVPGFMTTSSYKKFRKYFYDRWEFKGGFLFRADEFNGTASSWGCSHTLWRKGKDARTSFDLTIKERDEHGLVQDIGTKLFYYPDERASKWVKAPRKLWWGKGRNTPQLSSSVEVKDKKKNHSKMTKDALGCFVNHGNNPQHNQTEVFFLSSGYSSTWGLSVFPQNFRRCVALFTARKTIKSNWVNQKDEYCAPDEDHPDYDQWVNDCIVYSLFHSSSQQSSLRGIDYDDKKWDIENEFFWMSNQEMQDLADTHGFVEMYNDAMRFKEDRYVYKDLQKITLSPDAQELLDMSKDLIRQAMPFREQAHYAKPEMHLNAWDAGWYQVRKGILEDYFPDEYEDFRKQFLEFEDRMREGVFKFGFLEA